MASPPSESRDTAELFILRGDGLGWVGPVNVILAQPEARFNPEVFESEPSSRKAPLGACLQGGPFIWALTLAA